MRFPNIAITVVMGTATAVHAFAPGTAYIRYNNDVHQIQSLKTTSFLLSSPSNDVSSTSDTTNDFQNDGLFSWMIPFLGTFGFTEGKSSVYAIPMSLPADTIIPSEKEIAKRQSEAAENMFNIGPQERERRSEASKIAFAVTIGYAILSSLKLDQGDIMGHLVRFGIIIPGFIAVGLRKSAELGL